MDDEVKCFTLGVRQVDGEIEVSAITEISRPDFKEWDRVNELNLPNLKTIRYFSDKKEWLEYMYEGFLLAGRIADMEYFEKFVKAYPEQSTAGRIVEID